MLQAGSRVLCGHHARCLARHFTKSSQNASAAMVNFSNDSQDALVNSLVQQDLVSSPRVEGVLRALDRRDFTFTHIGIPGHVSYTDGQLPIGQGQFISAPSLHAVCLELLEGHLRPGASVLDVGSGSGYLTGCFSLLVGPRGRVVALERHERLVEQAGWALARGLSAMVGDVRPSEYDHHHQHRQHQEEETGQRGQTGQRAEQHAAPGNGGASTQGTQAGSAPTSARQGDTGSAAPSASASASRGGSARAVATALQPQPEGPRPGPEGPGRLPSLRLYNLELIHGNALDEAALAAATAAAPGGLFDVIHVGGAVREVPGGLVALLRPEGRLVLPVGPPGARQSLTVVDKAADGAITVTRIRDIKLQPLAPPNAEKPL